MSEGETNFYICNADNFGHIPMIVRYHENSVGRVFIHLVPQVEGGFLAEIRFLGNAWLAADSLKEAFNKVVSTRLFGSGDAALDKIADILREHGFKQTETLT